MLNRVLDAFLPTRRQPVPEMETAGDTGVILSRGVAAGMDLVLCYVFLETPVIYVFSEVFEAEFEALGAAAIGLSVVFLLPIYATYSFAFEWGYGRTPGKVNRGLVVVMADGRRCTMRASAVRNLLLYVDVLGVPPVVVGLVSAFLRDGRRIGDVAAGTVVARASAPDDPGHVATADLDASAGARAGEGT